MDDVTLFLKAGKFESPVFLGLYGKKVPLFVVTRLVAIYGFRKGDFSFIEIIQLLLPGRFRPVALRAKFWKFLDSEAKNEFAPFLTPDGSILLYGHPFSAPLLGENGDGYYYLATLLFEVIVSDQYHTAEYLHDGAVIVDAGANIGTFSALASHTIKNGKILAFEPSPDMFAVLRKNIKDVPTVSCYPMGLGDSVTRKMIHGTTFEDSGMVDLTEGKEADITTLDQFVAENNIPRIDFIKMDTEGYEGQILKGARESIKKWKPIIAMSAYHHPNDKKDLPALLKSICSDYVCELKKESEEDFICYVP